MTREPVYLNHYIGTEMPGDFRGDLKTFYSLKGHLNHCSSPSKTMKNNLLFHWGEKGSG